MKNIIDKLLIRFNNIKNTFLISIITFLRTTYNLFIQYVSMTFKWLENYLLQYLLRFFFFLIAFFLFLIFENWILIYLIKFWNIHRYVENNDIIKHVLFLIFIILFYLFRKKTTTYSFDILLITVYFKYRFFSEYTPKFEGFTIEFWEYLSIYSVKIIYIDFIPLFYGLIVLSYIFTIIRGESSNNESGYYHLDLTLKDLAIINKNNIDDEDKYGRTRFANEIVKSIEKMRPYKAFSIGISGEWGSGKSSLFNIIKNKLEQNQNDIKVLEFTPWQSSSEEALIIDFFKVLEKNFQANIVLTGNLINYANAVATAEEGLIKTQILKTTLLRSESLKERYEKIAKELSLKSTLFVIMIDDLDRLNKKEIISVLKLIRVIADFPNIVYLVAYDRQYVNSAIKELTDYMPEKFVDKIFNMEFTIPEISSDKIIDELLFHLIYSLKKIDYSITDKEFRKIFKKIKTEYFIKTQRDVKRFCNNFIISFDSVRDYEIDFESFFLLQLLNYKHPEIYKKIYDNQDELLLSCANSKKGNKKQSEILISTFLNLNHTTAPANTIINIVFNSKSEYSISSRLDFHKYFSLSIFGNEIKGIQVEEALKLDIEELNLKIDDFFIISDQLLIIILKEKLSIVTSKSYEELEKYIQALHHVYIKLQQQITPDIDEEKQEEIEGNLLKISETCFDIIENVEFKEKYKRFNLIFNSAIINTSYINNYLKDKNREGFNEIELISDHTTKFINSPDFRDIPKNRDATTTRIHSEWARYETDFSFMSISNWLTARQQITKEEGLNGGSYNFEKKFELPIDPLFLEEAKLSILVDDTCIIKINDSKETLIFSGFDKLNEVDIKEHLNKGSNTIRFQVVNTPFEKLHSKETSMYQQHFDSNDLGEIINPYGFKFLIRIR